MKINPILYVVAGIVVLGGLFFMFKPKAQAPTSTTQPKSQQTPTPTIVAPKVFELVVAQKKLVSGPETIQVIQGDDVVIKITVDEDEEFHIHGYDKSIDVEKNIQGELSFTASLSGRFHYELEHSKTEIGALEVQPKQ